MKIMLKFNQVNHENFKILILINEKDSLKF